jgi:ribosomal protein S18 acetylase RimI-like enzyme
MREKEQPMIIRQARAADIPALVELRMRLFCEVGELDHPQADPVLWQATADYFTRAAGDEIAFSWLAEAAKKGGDPQIVAAGTLALFVRPPYPGNLAGYLLNMYILPEWRRQGLATALFDAITAYAKARELGKRISS